MHPVSGSSACTGSRTSSTTRVRRAPRPRPRRRRAGAGRLGRGQTRGRRGALPGGARPRRRARDPDATLALLADAEAQELVQGKMVLELMPADRPCKGGAGPAARRGAQAVGRAVRRDDVADLEAFHALGTLASDGVLVARVAVRGPETACLAAGRRRRGRRRTARPGGPAPRARLDDDLGWAPRRRTRRSRSSSCVPTQRSAGLERTRRDSPSAAAALLARHLERAVDGVGRLAQVEGVDGERVLRSRRQ